MRTRKYRAWDKENKVFIDGFYIEQNGDIRNIGYSGFGEPHTLLNHRLVIEEYIGKNDRNKVEIFDGDIVRVLYSDWASKAQDDKRTIDEYMWDIGINGIVEWVAPSFVINFGKGKYGNIDYGSFNVGPHGYIQVTGNIHEDSSIGLVLYERKSK